MTKEQLEKCRNCKSYKDAGVFELCTREESFYTAEGRTDFHTCSHMRLYNCGAEARLWRPA